MEKSISTALMTIAAVAAALAIINATLPAVGRGTSALIQRNSEASEKIRTAFDIIYVAGDASATDVIAWVKNTGSSTIAPIKSSDVILETPTTFQSLDWGTGSDEWDYVLEDSATDWAPTETLKITLDLTSLAAGTYTLTFITPNGVKVSEQFSV